MHGTESMSSRWNFAASRLLACALLPILPLLLAACDAVSPTTMQAFFASDTYDGVEGYGVRVVVRLDKAPGRSVEIPLVVTGSGDHRLFEWHGDPDPMSGERTVRSVSAVSFSGDETEKAIFVQTDSDNDQNPSFATIRFGTLPAAVEEDSPSSAEIKIYAAPGGQLDLINNLTMPHPARADFETTGTLDRGDIQFAEFGLIRDDFASITAMSWKETAASTDTVTNIDTRVSYVRIVDASTGTDTLSLQIPVENQCPDRKNEPPRSEWPCIIDDIADTETGEGMVRASNHIIQARLGAGTYQTRVEAVAAGPYRVTIHLNEEVFCYIDCPPNED
jgi:hypothetical protein